MTEPRSEPARDWLPLLEGDTAAEARAVVHGIVEAVAVQPPSQQQGMQGDASVALLLAHCCHPTASHKLDLALSAAATRPLSSSLFSGAPGLLWLLHRVGASDETGPLIAHLEAAVLDCLSVPYWKDRYDLVSDACTRATMDAGRASPTSSWPRYCRLSVPTTRCAGGPVGQ